MNSPRNIADIRSEYARATLDEGAVDRDPFAQFSKWFDEALACDLPMPNAMSVATVDASLDTAGAGPAPDTRMVLLKGFDAHGFVFYTNYDSRKGRELAANPRAALLFFWPELERQVRIEGSVDKVGDAEADAYFRSRPLGARLGAWASPQSAVIPGRVALETGLAEATQKHGEDPPRPPHWGGYRVAPHRIEFWQGRRNRLHDRVRYEKQGGTWRIERLAP
jgi:pyridoxamine 5'-phosphate oxidase